MSWNLIFQELKSQYTDYKHMYTAGSKMIWKFDVQ